MMDCLSHPQLKKAHEAPVEAHDEAHERAHDEAHDEAPVEAPLEAPVALKDTELRILRLCLISPRSKKDILQGLGYSSITGNVKKALQRLDELGFISYTIPDRPNSKNQMRQLTAKGRGIVGRTAKAARVWARSALLTGNATAKASIPTVRALVSCSMW